MTKNVDERMVLLGMSGLYNSQASFYSDDRKAFNSYHGPDNQAVPSYHMSDDQALKVHKREKFLGSDIEICTFS
jgi:hypothetical protein